MNTRIPSDKLGDYLRTAKPQPGVPEQDPRFPVRYIGPKEWPGSAPAPAGEPGPPGLGAAADQYRGNSTIINVTVPSASAWLSDNAVIGDLSTLRDKI